MKYLWHGSPQKVDSLIPNKAHDIGFEEGCKLAVYATSSKEMAICFALGCETECLGEAQNAIYAAATFDEVIPFALPFRWYPDSPDGRLSFDSDGINSFLHYGSINPNGKGYVYVLPSDTFELVDEWEWISRKEVKPIEIIEICVKDYWHTITFSDAAKAIQKEMYGE